MKAKLVSIKGSINAGQDYYAIDITCEQNTDIQETPITLRLSESDYFRLSGYDDRDTADPGCFLRR